MISSARRVRITWTVVFDAGSRSLNFQLPRVDVTFETPYPYDGNLVCRPKGATAIKPSITYNPR